MFVQDEMKLDCTPLVEGGRRDDSRPRRGRKESSTAPPAGTGRRGADAAKAPPAAEQEARRTAAPGRQGHRHRAGAGRAARRADGPRRRTGDRAGAADARSAASTTTSRSRRSPRRSSGWPPGLRDTTMGIRMVPIGSLFGRFRRLVHDLSRDLGKQVELVDHRRGDRTRQDHDRAARRSAGPSHPQLRSTTASRTADERIAAGKPATGRVELAARQVRRGRC